MERCPTKLLLTLAEATKLIGLSDDTLRKEMNAGRLPYIRVGRSRYLTRHDIDRWLDAKREEWQATHAVLNHVRSRRSSAKAQRLPVIGFEEARKKLKFRKPE